MNANVKVATLTSELFQLVGKFQELTVAVHSDNEFTVAVASLSAAYEQLKACDLAIDAARDPKDQEYAFTT